MLQHIPGNTVARDAEHHLPAQGTVGLEDGATMSKPAQEQGRSKPRRPAADNRYMLGTFVLGSGKCESLIPRPITNVLLDGIDADVPIQAVAVAALLAGGGTDTAHDRGEGVRHGHALKGILLPGLVALGPVQTAHDR